MTKKDILRINTFLYAILIFVAFTIASCENKTEEKSAPVTPLAQPGRKLTGNDFQEFYKNGKLRMEGKLINGKREGVWKSYYEDGNLWSVGMYVNGKRQGTGVVFYSNGKKYMEGDYKDDVRDGKWFFYNEKGDLIKEVDFNKK